MLLELCIAASLAVNSVAGIKILLLSIFGHFLSLAMHARGMSADAISVKGLHLDSETAVYLAYLFWQSCEIPDRLVRRKEN